jgi:hypothetical protein
VFGGGGGGLLAETVPRAKEQKSFGSFLQKRTPCLSYT